MDNQRKNMPVRISEESLKWARIAASYKGMNLADYVSEALVEVARRDAQTGHAEMMEASEQTKVEATGPKRKRGPKSA